MALERSPSPLRVLAGGAASEASHDSSRDQALIRAVLAGELSAATAFHDRLKPVVERTLARLLGRNDIDSEDLTQQALMALVLGLDRFRGDCPLEAWASVVAARVVYRKIRRRRVERRLFVVEDVEASDVAERPASDGALFRSALHRVDAHLRQLSPDRAWTFVLHDVLGHSLAEVSSITGVSEAAAQSRLVRGRKELHQRIAGDPELRGLFDAKESQNKKEEA